MADYKESAVAGNKWQRATKVVIDNPYNTTPSISFIEEEMINLGDTVHARPCGGLFAHFDPSNALHSDIYSVLDTLYTLLREERDRQPAPTE